MAPWMDDGGCVVSSKGYQEWFRSFELVVAGYMSDYNDALLYRR